MSDQRQEHAFRMLRVSRSLRTAAADVLAQSDYPEGSTQRSVLSERARQALAELTEEEKALHSLVVTRLLALSKDDLPPVGGPR